MAYVAGKRCRISVGGSYLKTTSVSWTLNEDIEEVTVQGEDAKSYIPTTYGYEISASCLWDTAINHTGTNPFPITVGAAVAVIFDVGATSDTADSTFSVSGYITSMEISGEVGGVTTYDLSITATGAGTWTHNA